MPFELAELTGRALFGVESTESPLDEKGLEDCCGGCLMRWSGESIGCEDEKRDGGGGGEDLVGEWLGATAREGVGNSKLGLGLWFSTVP